MKLNKLVTAMSIIIVTNMVSGQEAGQIAWGSFDVVPSVNLGLIYDDNTARTNGNEISSWASIISPEVTLLNNFGSSQVQFGYRATRADYFSSSEDNYTDHFLSANVDYELNSRHRLNTNFTFEDGHDARGQGFTNGRGNELLEVDQYKETDFGIGYSYGAITATARLDAYFDIRTLDYDRNELQYLVRDRNYATIGGTFFYRVGAVTDLTFDIIRTDVDYKFSINPTVSLNSTKHSYLVGIKWESSAATSGFVKVGYETKDFDSSAREDFNGFDYAAGLKWEPVDYSSFELRANNDTNESNGDADFIQSRDLSAAWNHKWLDRLRTTVSFGTGSDDYIGALDGREDDLTNFNAKVIYQFRRWIRVEAGYTYDERDSSREIVVYDRNQFKVNAQFTL